ALERLGAHRVKGVTQLGLGFAIGFQAFGVDGAIPVDRALQARVARTGREPANHGADGEAENQRDADGNDIDGHEYRIGCHVVQALKSTLIATTRTAATRQEAATLPRAPRHPCSSRQHPARRGGPRDRRRSVAARDAPRSAPRAACRRSRRSPARPLHVLPRAQPSAPQGAHGSPARTAAATETAPPNQCRAWRRRGEPSRDRARGDSTGNTGSATTARFRGPSPRDTPDTTPWGVCLPARLPGN